jgi:hypothetical protein
MILRIAAAIALFGASAIGMSSQQTIHVRVVESKHLRPVTDECLNITLGKWRGAELFLPTDSAGQIALTIEDDKVSALFVPAKACNTSSISGPTPFDSLAHEISIVTDEYVSCQYSGKLVKDPAWRNASPAQRIPSFSVQEILDHGITATNSCTKLRPTAKPGELIIVVRKRTFLEGMRS